MMRALSIIVTLQGLTYFLQSIIGLYRGSELKIGVQLINSNYNVVGVIIGTWLIAAGIGIWRRKRYAYSLTIIIYSILGVYGIISVCYILATQPIDSGIVIPMLLAAIVLILFFIVIKYVRKNKIEFR